MWSLKKRSSLRIHLALPTFRPNFIMISNKHLQLTETICAIFKGKGQRQLPHSPHSISTTVCNRCFRNLLLFKNDQNFLSVLMINVKLNLSQLVIFARSNVIVLLRLLLSAASIKQKHLECACAGVNY